MPMMMKYTAETITRMHVMYARETNETTTYAEMSE